MMMEKIDHTKSMYGIETACGGGTVLQEVHSRAACVAKES